MGRAATARSRVSGGRTAASAFASRCILEAGLRTATECQCLAADPESIELGVERRFRVLHRTAPPDARVLGRGFFSSLRAKGVTR